MFRSRNWGEGDDIDCKECFVAAAQGRKGEGGTIEATWRDRTFWYYNTDLIANQGLFVSSDHILNKQQWCRKGSGINSLDLLYRFR
jgi:hypothetical protein